LKKEWPSKPLGEVCQVIGGGTPSKGIADYYAGDIPWATVRDMRRETILDTEFKISAEAVRSSATNIIPAGNVVIATRVGLGKVCVLGQDTAINQDLRGIVPNSIDEITVRFLFLWFKSIAHLIEQEGTGATVQGIKLPFVKSLAVPLPPLPEQQRIVRILDEAFEGIAAAKAKAEKNLQNARALFEGYLSSVFKSTGDDWKEVTLSELASDITDGDHMPPPKSESGVPFITISNINKKTNKIDFSNTFTVSADYFRSLKANRKPRRGDVLYTVTGSFGIPVIVDNDDDFCFQRHIGLIRPNSETVSKWLYYLLLSPDVIKQAEDRATGTAQKTVSLKVLRSLMVPKMSVEQQRLIVAKLDLLLEQSQRLESVYKQKIAALEELKKSLLHQAFNGEL
jgi:type I restriction enzyme S subunit